MKHITLTLSIILSFLLYGKSTEETERKFPIDSIVLETSRNWAYITGERLWPTEWGSEEYREIANMNQISFILKVNKDIIILGRPPKLFQNDLYNFDTLQDLCEYFHNADMVFDREEHTLLVQDKYGDQLYYVFNPVFDTDFTLEKGQIKTNNIAHLPNMFKIGTDITYFFKKLGLLNIDYINFAKTYAIYMVPDEFYLNNIAMKLNLSLDYGGKIIIQVVDSKIYSIEFTEENIYTEYIWKRANQYN